MYTSVLRAAIHVRPAEGRELQSSAPRGRKQLSVLHLSQVLLAADDRPEVDARSLISAPNLS